MTDNEWYAYMYEQALDDIYAEMNDMYLDMQAEPPVIEDEDWEDEDEYRDAEGTDHDRF